MRRVRRRRADFQAQTARRLVSGNALVVLEDLNVRGMTASAGGTAARPGRMVAQKAGLNRAILDKGWYGLEMSLRNAARTTGARIRKINPAYTSQTCPGCGQVDADFTQEPSGVRVYLLCLHRACGCRRREEHSGRRAWRVQDVEPSRHRPGP
ncbi:zinc ribbon domain-containing protein [Streptomyces sp. NPDC095613]|uniref:zinc ribbon domain-containing protein n=1 Tax=Streptomyces sp. NPDC095613 TaxID=3155540 RepID=UPI00332414BA